MVVNKFWVGDEFNLNRQWVEGEKSIEISENFSRQFEFINLKSFKIRERGGKERRKNRKKLLNYFGQNFGIIIILLLISWSIITTQIYN